jgi:hypothetical protein
MEQHTFYPCFFPILLSFLWFPYNYFMGQNFQGGLPPPASFHELAALEKV